MSLLQKISLLPTSNPNVLVETPSSPASQPRDPSRRQFLRQVVAAVGTVTFAGAASSLIEACSTTTGPVTVTHGTTTVSIASLTQNGQGIFIDNVQPEGTPLLIVRKASDQYVALSSRCTHENCQVNKPSSNSIYCSCHGSRFDLDGKVTSGPANTPLTKFTARLDAASGQLTVDY